MSVLPRFVEINLSVAASSLRGWRGTAAFHPAQTQPARPLELYDIENCPYCRLVREVLTELDLDAVILPCPKGGDRFRPDAVARGGKAQFPLLHDPNSDTWLYESADIIAYLRRTYAGRGPQRGVHALKVLGSDLASGSRILSGMRARSGRRAPEQLLELYSFESSPFSRLVRERLCELELPYLLRNTGKAAWKDMGPPQLRAALFPDAPVTGRNRQALLARAGKVQVPYLVDPNTGTEMFESAAILDYLDRHYG